MNEAILALGVLYFISRGFSLVFQRYQIPDVLLLMLLGICVGPIFGIVSPEAFGKVGHVITTIALVVILFEGGLGTRVNEMIKAVGSSSSLTLLTMISTWGIAAVVAYFLTRSFSFEGMEPWSIPESLLLGAIISGTSSAVVIPMMGFLKTGTLIKDALVLESALTDVLCIVASFALIGILQQSGDLHFGALLGQTISSLLFAAVLGVMGGVFWVWVWKRLVDMKNDVFTTIAFALVIYGAIQFLGFSGAIGALAFGLTLNNYDLLPAKLLRKLGSSLPSVVASERSLFKEFVFVLKTFFFVFLGIQMPLKDWQPHLIAFAILFGAYLCRVIICRSLLKRSAEFSLRDIRIASVMIPKGLAAAVLGSVPTQLGLKVGPALEATVYAVVLQSILVTSLLVWLIPPSSGERAIIRS